MDNDYSADVDDIAHALATSDVVILKFVTVGERLLIDFRTTGDDCPFVRVVPPVRSLDERRSMIRKWRPRLEEPELVAVGWHGFVRSLRTSGLWEVVRDRVREAGHDHCVEEADRAYRTLLMLEAAMQRKAIRGHGFRTLWSASPAPR